MALTKSTVLGLAFAALAAPAFAGGLTFELPRLTFPDSKPPVVTQTCASVVALNADSCATK